MVSDDSTPAADGRAVAAEELDDLLAAVAAGDEAAFAAFYDRTAAQVHGLVRRVLRNEAQSEEVTQEVMVEVWRSATRFDRTRGSATSYLMTIAHRRAVDRVRSSQASSDRDERVGRASGSVAFDEVSEAVETRFEHEQVRAALGGLTDVQREAVELAYFGGLTYREVAEHLGLPLGTVKARLRDGLRRMRLALEVAP